MNVSDPVEERISDLDGALVLLERARRIPEGRAVIYARISLYNVQFRLESLQPTAGQWTRINERLAQLNNELTQFN